MSTPHHPARPPFTFTVSGVVASLLVFAVAAGCVRLGFWQLDRMRQRRERNEQVEERMRQGAIDVAAALRDTAGLGYRSIELAGRFDDDRSIVLPGRAYRGTPGAHLLTPLRLEESAIAVLVNRGWVPAADGASIDPERFRTRGAATVIDGLILPFPRARASLASNAPAPVPATGFRRVWFTIDESSLREQFPYPLAAFLVQALPDSTVAGPAAAGARASGGRGGASGADARAADPYPLRLPPPPLDAGPHLGYAIQWFSFAAIAIIGWLTIARRRAGR